jgi:5-methylcytosine-specific restriction protein A
VESRRGSARERGYTAAWGAYSKARLYHFPLCVDPYGDHGKRLVLAVLTDHVVPHKDNRVLFWESTNHQSLCKPCHDRKTATEDGGFGNQAGERQAAPASQEAEAWCF